MSQQDQTKKFFKGHAKQWQLKAVDEVYSVINDRHRAVHKCLDNYPTDSRLLDVGCGTGQLAIEVSKRGFRAVGIDFAEEMIDIAKDNATRVGSSALFEEASVFDYSSSDSFDVISAMGFIEYVSLSQLDQFLEFSNKNLRDGGAISVGSRNRLFNLTTFNDYTLLEMELDTIKSLLEEANIVISSKDKSEFLSALREFSGNENLIQNDTHPLTGIGVETRYQYTPSDLLKRVEKFGFEVTNIYPVNYHSFNPVNNSSDTINSVQKQLSEFVSEEQQMNFHLIANSSSFVLEAVKCR
jgi:2-polyprenyl-3-methyl-5-hydroxy-6-metoxy-1,4-benzoquinol methylase